MVNVKIAKMCGCVKKANMPEIEEFENLELAMKHASELAEEMNETFCKKHNFSVSQNSENELVVIEVNLNN
jgi:hypothetical protein